MKTELSDELVSYIGQKMGMPVLDHPLIGLHPYHESDNDSYNKLLEKRQTLLSDALKNSDYGHYVNLFSNGHRLTALSSIYDRLTEEQKVELTVAVYIKSENIDKTEWRNFFKNMDCLLADKEGRNYYESINDVEELTIYKGISAADYNKNENETFSWTIDRETANFFANRWDEGIVVKAKVLKKDIIGFLFGRNESEILVLPKNVNNKTVIN